MGVSHRSPVQTRQMTGCKPDNAITIPHEYVPGTRLLLLVGCRENFYRDLKR